MSNLIVRSAPWSGVNEWAPRLSIVMQASCVLLPHARKPSLPEACSKARSRAIEVDARTHMLLTRPIAPTILRLAIPNATVMIVQILIGLLEVYFVSRAGVDALAG